MLRADAGHAIGSGHVMRLTALAEAATDSGGVAHTLFGGGTAAEVIGHARRLDATAVVDGPMFTAAYVATLAAAGLRVASLDDRGIDPLPTAAVLNHNLGAESLADRYAAATVRLLGRSFHLLRRDLRRLARGCAARAADVRRVLVTMGGSDPVGATARVLAAVPPPGLTLVVILGPRFRRDAAFEAAAAAAAGRGHTIELHTDPAHLPHLMSSCEMAVSAAGGTLGELNYLGLPTLALAIVSDQLANARRHAAAGLALGGHPLASLDDATLASLVTTLRGDLALRIHLADAGAQSLDGRGALRAAAMLSG